ncbi:cell wall hydrolase [Marinicrinis sediminis]|uniref:Cell wall hydrolase n=1 Tax=Marinicrinis sediminis TaxID=1652465 RepID=A0ABW5R8W0_9BACL
MMQWTGLVAIVIVMMFSSVPPTSAAATPSWTINGEAYTFDSKPLMKNQRWHLPIREVADALQANIEWDQQARSITVLSPYDDEVIMEWKRYVTTMNDEKYISDSAPFMSNGRLYISMRHAAEMLHMQVNWEPEGNVISLQLVPLYEVKEDDTWQSVSKQLEVEVEKLKQRNTHIEGKLAAGDSIKWVIPSMMSEELVNPNLILLAKLIFAEAGYESYEGQLAVGNVVMNRVAHSSFPSTLQGVIYAPGQFTPARTGKLERMEPSDESLQAAREALLGVNVAGDALYFYNPKVSGGSFFNSLEVVVNIGNHRFAK